MHLYPAPALSQSGPLPASWGGGMVIGDVRVLFRTLEWVAFYYGNENSLIMEHCPLIKSHVSETLSFSFQ